MIDKTYIVNLERRRDKRKHMEEEIEKLNKQGINLNHIFFSAIDGTNSEILSKIQFKTLDWFDPNSGKAMTNGEVGCALSHYLIWKDIVSQVDNGTLTQDCKILILEDDVVFIEDFIEKLKIYTAETSFVYDMLYVHRKPLDLIHETKISTHINKANKSYWTCAYILTYFGAQKLVNSNYVNNLIPVDEFLPIMYGCNIFGYEKYFEKHEKINCYAVCPSLMKLTNNAFADSETFHSKPFITKNTYQFTDKNNNTKDFLMMYVGPCEGQSYQRFVYYCKLYAIPIVILDNSKNEISQLDLIQNEMKSWNQDKLDSTLVLIVSVNLFDQCNILPVASPKEIIDKYFKLAIDDNSIVTIEKDPNNKKNIFCSWAKNIHNSIDDYSSNINKLKNNNNNDVSIETFLAINSLVNKNVIYDDKCEIFQLLNNNTSIIFNHKTSRIINAKTKTVPCFLLSYYNQATIMLNRIENYTGNNWNEYYGYKISDMEPNTQSLPKIYVSFNLGENKYILNFLDNLNYPKELLVVKINSVSKTETSNMDNTIVYNNENDLYQKDLENFLESGCDYYFFVNNDCILNNSNVLNELLSLNKSVVAPLIRKGNEAWTNFWGDLDENGYYRRSFDYFDIINGKRKGCWNVPYVTGTYLIKKEIIQAVPELFTDKLDMDPDMRMCYHLRENDIFMYVSNLSDYGYIEATATEMNIIGEITLTDLLVKEKKAQWEMKYLHPTYYQNKNNLENLGYVELCDGIYTFPLFSEIFCKEMMQRAESYGKWSKGKDEHNDPRLGQNYYENVPTVDVQLFELNLDKQWHEIVFSYIAPVARVLYNNYKTKDINLAFVVKYDFNDQSSLSPHHDASTYTVNIALNKGNGIDYDGGGCRFIRQNYILKNQEPGMCCIHPGRLTAYHEGLPVTAGTRYILVSFIN
ncbi:putative procollagen-lysine [Tupanvirus deep ocean]|uniref:Procollagen-lysine n=2 Tax=Tupanvirus TaxID=2094720 RepID=A0AC62A955_9VIRU|nr:putative procollagen-lysine [Tupanvirus deep ocean]QKU34307.1 putative procollagen-lysine [Tupanvirus deep ocean]